jgi:hypothetical protein
MDWKLFVEKQNAETYVLPKDWTPQDEVAIDLDCSQEKVDDHLRPALKSGRVLKQQYQVWDAKLKRVVRVWAYHDTSKDVKKEEQAPVIVEADVAKMQEMKSTGSSYADIGAVFNRSGESIRKLLKREEKKLADLQQSA